MNALQPEQGNFSRIWIFQTGSKMAQPLVSVLGGYGLNCEEETAFAFELAGANARIIHVNDLISRPEGLRRSHILAIPGGFSYGDDTGSGNALANKLRNHLWPQILDFTNQDRLIIGICNGFQVLVNLGLVPALKRCYGQRQAALTHNASARYLNRWVDLKLSGQSPWFKGMKQISLPIAHGEGRFFARKSALGKIKRNNLIAARYVKASIFQYQSLPANPNGSLGDVAALTDEPGRVLGMMPHPERAIFFTQLPHWPLLKERYERAGKRLPKWGPGLEIFKNGVGYFR